MADYGWTGEDAPASGNMVNHLRQTLAMKDLNDKKARELALKEEFLQRKIDQRKALMDRNVGQFQQSWKGAAPGSMPPEMIRAQMVLAKMNGSPGRVVAGQAAQADPYADTPEDTARKAAMNAKPMIGNTAAFGRIPGPLSMTTAEQSNAARQRAMQPGFHRMSHAEIVAARQEARMQAMQRLQQMAMAPHIALAMAQHPADPQRQAMANYYNAAAQQINGSPPGATPETAQASPPAQATQVYVPPQGTGGVRRRQPGRPTQESERQMNWFDFLYRPPVPIATGQVGQLAPPGAVGF